jgi:hypothetical protein
MIDSKLMQKFLDLAHARLKGEWVIIGGTLLPLVGIDHRVTVDIDIINLDLNKTVDQTLELMDLAQTLNLPVETINQAGAYYFSKIVDAKDHIVLLQESANCKIYRQDVYLYMKLKIDRLSESDLMDVIHFIKKFRTEAQQYKQKILDLIESKKSTKSEEASERILKLESAVTQIK